MNTFIRKSLFAVLTVTSVCLSPLAQAGDSLEGSWTGTFTREATG